MPEHADPTIKTVDEKGHHKMVDITVNNRAVQIDGPRVTGLQIKQAAIAQGVPIDLDFQLTEIRNHGERQIIGDSDVTTVTKHSKFVATASDDNS